jgi:hypothetical protein
MINIELINFGLGPGFWALPVLHDSCFCLGGVFVLITIFLSL